MRLIGDSKRIFETVVRPSENGQGDLAAEIERLRKEVDRGERMLGNQSFVENAPPDVVEAEKDKLEQYRAELDALGG